MFSSWAGVAVEALARGGEWVLLAGEGDAGDLLEVGEEFDVLPGGEEGGDEVAPAVADFEGELALGWSAEGPWGMGWRGGLLVREVEAFVQC